MSAPLLPIDTAEQRLALAASNRRVLAERTGWPDGYLAACEQIDADHPGWFTNWRKACLGPPKFAYPAGFYSRWRNRLEVYGETAAELVAAITVAERQAAEETARRRVARTAPWHIPNPYTYDCRNCGSAWPCEDAQEELIDLWPPDVLDLRMTAEMELARPVLPDVPLEPRFLGWIRQLRER